MAIRGWANDMTLKIIKAILTFLLLLHSTSSTAFLTQPDCDGCSSNGGNAIGGVLVLIVLAFLFLGWIVKVSEKQAGLPLFLIVPGGIGLLIVSNASRFGFLMVGWILITGAVLGLYLRATSSGSDQVSKGAKSIDTSEGKIGSNDFSTANNSSNATSPERPSEVSSSFRDSSDSTDRMKESNKTSPDDKCSLPDCEIFSGPPVDYHHAKNENAIQCSRCNGRYLRPRVETVFWRCPNCNQLLNIS